MADLSNNQRPAQNQEAHAQAAKLTRDEPCLNARFLLCTLFCQAELEEYNHQSLKLFHLCVKYIISKFFPEFLNSKLTPALNSKLYKINDKFHLINLLFKEF